MVGSGAAEVSASIKGIRPCQHAKASGEAFGKAPVIGNLVDGLARHAQCTSQGGLIAVIEAEGVRFLDGEGFFHGWR